MLGVLDAKTCIGVFASKGGFKLVQHFPVGTVANGMDTQLKPPLQGGLAHRQHCLHGRGRSAAVVGPVTVGLEQPGAARPQGAVGDQLDRPYGEKITLAVNFRPSLEPSVEQGFVPASQHHPQSCGQLSPGIQGAVGVDIGLAAAGILKTGDAISGKLRQRQAQCFPVAFGRVIWHDPEHQIHGVFRQDTCRTAIVVLDDLAAIDEHRVPVYPRQRHGPGIKLDGMSTGVVEHDRVVGADLAEQSVRLETLDLCGRWRDPFALVPAVADDPFPG